MTIEPSSYLFSSKIASLLPMVVGGKGNYLTIEDPITRERRQIFDALGGAAVTALGHGDEDIINEMAEAAKECTYSFPASMTNYHAEQLAKFYINTSPEGVFASALFTGSGSEANENAMKIIRQYYLEKGEPERTVFISRKQSYHGYTLGALSLGESSRKDQFREITLPATQTPKVSPCYPYRHQSADESLEQYTERLLNEIEETFVAVGPGKVASFVCETLTGSTFGTCPATPGYLQGVRRICDKYGIIMWLDEVMCGTGRSSSTGGLNCWESYEGFMGPDIQTIGKTLGSGYVTIAGILVSPKIKKAYMEGSGYIAGAQTYHQHSFNCRVALAVQKKIHALGLRQNSFEKGQLLGKLLRENGLESTKYKIIGDVRGLGGFWSLEIVKNKESKEPFPAELKVGMKIAAKCLSNGMTANGMDGTIDGKSGDHISLAPTFITTEEEIKFIAQTLLKSVHEVEEDLIASGTL